MDSKQEWGNNKNQQRLKEEARRKSRMASQSDYARSPSLLLLLSVKHRKRIILWRFHLHACIGEVWKDAFGCCFSSVEMQLPRTF